MRWDGDELGHGVGSAEAARPDLDRLSEAMVAPDWIAEAPELHLLPHLRAEADRDGSPWRLGATMVKPDGGYVVELDWTGDRPSRSEVRAELFRLVGAIAELSTHVRERRSDGRVEFEVTTGILDGDGAWRGHGHVVLFRIDVGA